MSCTVELLLKDTSEIRTPVCVVWQNPQALAELILEQFTSCNQGICTPQHSVNSKINPDEYLYHTMPQANIVSKHRNQGSVTGYTLQGKQSSVAAATGSLIIIPVNGLNTKCLVANSLSRGKLNFKKMWGEGKR